jgi:nitric oxide reductase NorE protein
MPKTSTAPPLSAPTAMAGPSVEPEWSSRLPGGAMIWIFIGVELATFFAFFVGYAMTYIGDPATVASSQELLSPLSGTINTVVLLTGSWMVARAVASARAGGDAWKWMAAASLSGVVFTAIKISEYSHTLGDGISLSTNTFWFYYLFMTVIHLQHVLAGIGFTAYAAWHLRKGSTEVMDDEAVEATAMYWHLIDLVWILLFPLLYLVGVPS